jgi:hypothetical protein
MALKNNEDAAFLLVNTLETILQFSQEVYAIVERVNRSWSPVDSFHYWKRNKGFPWDMFTLCTVAVDNGIIEIVSGLLAMTITMKESKLILGADGSIVLECEKYVNATTNQSQEVSTPTPLVKQVGLVAQTAQLIPQASAFLRNTITGITGFIESQPDDDYAPREEL